MDKKEYNYERSPTILGVTCKTCGDHLKAIAVDKGGQALLKIANIPQDAGVVDANDTNAFISAAKTRQWNRKKSVRTLA